MGARSGARARDCSECVARPLMHCGRCTTTRCAAHALRPGERCDRCELDWTDDAPTRRGAKLLLAPPVAILSGGMLFGLLLPLAVGSVVGGAVVAALACGTGAAAGASACRLVDRSARAVFLRERAGALPAARLLPSPRR